MKTASRRLIVALDAPALGPALETARRLRGITGILKVGSILFTAAGPEAVRRIKALGFGVMLDLKLFDIPTTVEKSCEAAGALGVRLLTVHASGGREMLRSAVCGARAGARRAGVRPPSVLAVTVLTSTGAGSRGTVRARVRALAREALAAGCAGVVASAQEAGMLRRAFGRRLLIVCPGIRAAAGAADDQRRVMTPEQAIAQGADLLVVGRPVTGAADPRAAAQAFIHAMEA
jgi:orotidine-5'-phosphate decarboxylase